jgi:ATP-binding cassette subfamily B protein
MAGQTIGSAAILFVILAVLTAALRLGLFWTSKRFAFALGHEVSVEIQRRLLRQPYAFHLRHHSSQQLASLDKVDLLVFDVVIQAAQGLSALLVSLFIIALLVAIDPVSTGLAVLIIGAFYGIAIAATRRRLGRYAETINSAHQQRLKFIQDSVGGIRDLILDQSIEPALDRFRVIDDAFARARSRTAFLAAAPRILIEAAGLVLIAMLAVVIAGRPGGFTSAFPFLGALALGAMRLLPSLGQLYGSWASLAIVGPVIADVAALLRLPLSDEGSTTPIPFHDSIRFEAVSFGYSGTESRVLEGINLTIPKGSRVAITGRTGSGKSTLVDLLMGLIQPASGRILVDDRPLGAERLPGWRRSIAHVPQDIFLADDTIAANIALSFQGGEINKQRIHTAARRAHLHQFIQTLPDQYETRIGERGVRLSGGQRQRLALARALYKGAALLILDEATSALDDQTEQAIMEALDELQSEGTTVVIVAHRLSTIAKCGSIFVLDKGRLIRSGTAADVSGDLRSLEAQGEL